MSTVVTPKRSGRWVLIARGLLVVAAVAALISAIGAVPTVVDAAPAARMAETWRAVGLLFFAALFAFLAARPQASPVLWTITVANKLVLTVLAIVYAVAGAADGALEAAVADGVLTVLLVAAFVLARR